MESRPDTSIPYAISTTSIKVRPHLLPLNYLFPIFLLFSLGFLFTAFNSTQTGYETKTEASLRILAPQSIQINEKWEAIIPVGNSLVKLNDYPFNHLEALITAPDGKTKTVNGIFVQDFYHSGSLQTQSLVPIPGTARWVIRYVPRAAGNYHYRFTFSKRGQMQQENGTFISTIQKR